MLSKIFNWFKIERSTKPSKELNEFLAAKDLDDLLRLSSVVKNLSEKDNQFVRKILKDWNGKQAISNLLFYPNIIPSDIRAKVLVRGLNEQKTIYYNLAAIVGVQNYQYFSTANEDTNWLKMKLFQFVKDTEDIRAMRATSALQNKITKEDLPKIIECGSNNYEGIRTNLIAMIVQLYGKENIEAQLIKHEIEYPKESKLLMKEWKRQIIAHILLIS